MSVIYKAVPKGQPGVVGGGTIKYYAGIVRQQPIEIRKFANEIASRCTLTTTDIYAVLESFLERLHVYIEEGRIVKLGEFGSFSPSLSSKGEESPEEVNQYSINRMKINFRPSRELQKRLDVVSFQKSSTATDKESIETT